MWQLVFFWVPCSHREWAWAKYTGRSAARVMAACRAISVPWSQVSDMPPDFPADDRFVSPEEAVLSLLGGLFARPREMSPPVFHREELALRATPSPVGSRVCVSLSPQADALVWRAEP
jgi:hypothetical protein